MTRRIRARGVLRLRSMNGLSQSAIARKAHASKRGVQGVLEAARGEWPLDEPDTEFRPMLLELMALRYGATSTVFCTQFKKKDWHPRLGGGVHADAIIDRIVHNATWVDMGEANMRQRRG